MSAGHANRGLEWQEILETWHDRYRRDRRAVIWPTPPRVKVLSRVSATTGQFRACFAGEGPPDYAGIVDGARPVVFDAKDCAGSRWSLGELQPHQARDLEAAHDRGGLAFVALRFGSGTAWVLPWSELGPRFWRWKDGQAARGEASIREGEIGHPMPELGDWLGALPS